MYQEECQKEQKHAASAYVYKYILNTNYNIGFHKPRKDQCLTCVQYDTFEGERTEEMEFAHETHINNSKRAR